ncbi:ADP-ribosylation factor GTPase-activating protein GCS1 [Verticillium alfalfae VaMs.102]|uniref:ADP-ribosylation factor GTPase-activating protein GCS1 n=1 Tax=Verticillium alfalfae (strain VaMs.102 / ATCC MYA-4576 / FGSC 10136) TaxID=526221 RepID=C9S715_VERA1|nr:ADP-ribosylation factor GTPase-activating protein GCS1 [Verticillium alfalfae VaMs.102]EEY14626.1 ADP-ribosylation factor GTPase-activating protein GCS1 [Verticillium alfalfae VaMs.102]
MASKAMWEVDPETRAKLAAIQKESKNNLCCDCNAPSPQWASPKFGVFICLSCAGVHRGLGVHISFVRSISMDAFKQIEIERMRLGGNENWKTFFEQHEDTKMRGVTWDDATIAERYSARSREWRELSPAEGKRTARARRLSGSAASRPSPAARSRLTTSTSPAGPRECVEVGGAPPSQGGNAAPTIDELQKDPIAALSKGFGWFTSTVTKTAKTVNDGYIQPTAKQLAESDFARQAQLAAGQVGRAAQQGARNANEGFNKFVEGGREGNGGYKQAPMDDSKRDFWDDFSSLADQSNQHKQQRSTGTGAIGTSAMKGGGSGGAAPPAKKKDEWDDCSCTPSAICQELRGQRAGHVLRDPEVGRPVLAGLAPGLHGSFANDADCSTGPKSTSDFSTSRILGPGEVKHHIAE